LSPSAARAEVSPVFAVASSFVDEVAALNPFWATAYGVAGHEDRVPDFSPAGADAAHSLNVRTAAKLNDTKIESDHDRVAADVLRTQISLDSEAFLAGDWQADLNIIASPLQSFCDVFELMATTTPDDWTARRDRLRLIPTSIAGYRQTLELGIANGRVAARRQAVEGAKQCESRSAHFACDSIPGFTDLPSTLRDELSVAAEAAGDAYRELGRWLATDYAAAAPAADGVGPERYVREASKYLGMTIDPTETYRWGLDQVQELRSHMELVAREIDPSKTFDEVVHLLDTDPTRAIHGTEALVEFLQSHMDSMLSVFQGTHFDIDPRARKITQMIAPPGGAAAQYYTGPSEDWSREGRCWFPTNGRTSFPMWGEITTANHEGVPGHHLQVCASMAASDRLSRYQRLYFSSGHGEGWALYAERLCFELGLLEKPDYVLGWLNGQMLRAVRVVIDIGMHCGQQLNIRVPENSLVAAGEEWNASTGLAYAHHYLGTGFDMVSEVDRYLGWPGQAISYKVGEREWLAAREEVKSALGGSFDLKHFHTVGLDLGAMGLTQFRSEVSRVLLKA
jgi:uncharacterized protein (DUF885 family)